MELHTKKSSHHQKCNRCYQTLLKGNQVISIWVKSHSIAYHPSCLKLEVEGVLQEN